jgi:hypothetical protein
MQKTVRLLLALALVVAVPIGGYAATPTAGPDAGHKAKLVKKTPKTHCVKGKRCSHLVGGAAPSHNVNITR